MTGVSCTFAISSLFLNAPFTSVTFPFSSNSVQRSCNSFNGLRRLRVALSSNKLGPVGMSFGCSGPAVFCRILCHGLKLTFSALLVEKERMPILGVLVLSLQGSGEFEEWVKGTVSPALIL